MYVYAVVQFPRAVRLLIDLFFVLPKANAMRTASPLALAN